MRVNWCNMGIRWVAFLLIMGSPLIGVAQQATAAESDTTEIYRITTRDGNEYLGTIIAEDAVRIHLKTENLGEIRLFRSDILQITKLDRLHRKRGTYWFANPQATRHFWIPNGYGLKKNESYYQNVWIFFNQVSTGITDHFSIGAGMVPLFLFAGSPTPVWVTPKVSFPVVPEKLNLGAGVLAGTIIGVDDGGFGLLYGLSTVGSKDRNLTLGLGWAYANGGIANRPTVSLAGMIRTGPRGYLLTENYLIGAGGESLGILSAGGRRMVGRSQH
ncbi:hypothetical protein [Cyclobacterium xiamenense]|uniref:hypothetical protein n=1 Tax=Cyclobacterium xiamenense TaxID=1297121 RepID=UPI0035D0232D